MMATEEATFLEYNGWRYGYTTRRLDDGKFAALIYRGDELVKEVRLTDRRAVKAKAERWHAMARSSGAGRPPQRLFKED